MKEKMTKGQILEEALFHLRELLSLALDWRLPKEERNMVAAAEAFLQRLSDCELTEMN